MTDPTPPRLPDPTKSEEVDGPPVVTALLIGAPIVLLVGAAASWAPYLLLAALLVVMLGMMSWLVGLLVIIVREMWRDR